jgi:putative holliday junction resolvase
LTSVNSFAGMGTAHSCTEVVMPVIPLSELPPLLPRYARLMGLDLGTKTVGMALSDVLCTIATPYDTLRRTKFMADAAALLAILDKQDVKGLVVGLPVEMDGAEGSRCQSCRAFVTNLLKIRDLPVAFWDERLSTAAVTRTLLEADTSRRRRAEVVDKMAAAYILQGALDAMKYSSGGRDV